MEPKEGVTIGLETLLEVGLAVRNVNFTPHQRANSILMGRHGSKLRGRGMDFLELKNYVAGDDTRHIDWRASRRTGKAQVRVFHEERERSVYLLLSQQSHLFFGTQGCFKSVQAAKIASLVIHAILKQGDRIGAVLFDDTDTSFFKASKNKNSALSIVDAIASLNQTLVKHHTASNTEMFNKALDVVMPHIKHDDLLILIGDGAGLDVKAQEKITLLSQHNDIIGVIVYDPLERTLPQEESLHFSWQNETLTLNGKDATTQALFQQGYEAKRQKYLQLSLLHRIPLFEIATDKDPLLQLQQQLGVLYAR